MTSSSGGSVSSSPERTALEVQEGARFYRSYATKGR